MNRNLKMDNFRALLIFTVVFGHFLECFGGQKRAWLYFMIYTFHMPAFAYVTGFFSGQNVERMVKKVLYSYFVYQFLYLMFQRYYLHQENLIQFTTPYWLLWYLLSLFCWMLLLPIIDYGGFRKCRVLGVTILLALLSGFDKSVGYTFSLSRTIVLLPYFILGHYRGKNSSAGEMSSSWLKRLTPVIIIVISAIVMWWRIDEIKGVWLYHSVSYEAGNYSIWIRGGLLLTAYAWIAFLLPIIPDRQIKIMTSLGKYSLPIYLLHGFVVKGIQKMQVFTGGELENILFAFFLAAVTCACLGNKWVAKIMGFTFSLK